MRDGPVSPLARTAREQGVYCWLTGQDGERRLVTGVPEGDAGALGELERVDLSLRDVERDRHREERAVLEAERLDTAAMGQAAGQPRSSGRSGSAELTSRSPPCP